MMSRLASCLAAFVVLAGVGEATAAVIIDYDSNGYATGATGLEVGIITYDAVFQSGSFNDVFGTGEIALPYTIGDAREAAVILSDALTTTMLDSEGDDLIVPFRVVGDTYDLYAAGHVDYIESSAVYPVFGRPRSTILPGRAFAVLNPRDPDYSPTTVDFEFFDDPTDLTPIAHGTHLPGGVTGTLFGLSDNGDNQIPTSMSITSDLSGLGMTDSSFRFQNSFGGDGFDITNGVVTDVDLGINFLDSTAGRMMIQFNASGRRNLVGWNNLGGWDGDDPEPADIGNGDGFAGASYTVSTVPEPSTLVIFAAFCLLAYRWRKRRS